VSGVAAVKFRAGNRHHMHQQPAWAPRGPNSRCRSAQRSAYSGRTVTSLLVEGWCDRGVMPWSKWCTIDLAGHDGAGLDCLKQPLAKPSGNDGVEVLERWQHEAAGRAAGVRVCGQCAQTCQSDIEVIAGLRAKRLTPGSCLACVCTPNPHTPPISARRKEDPPHLDGRGRGHWRRRSVTRGNSACGQLPWGAPA
jgi:hypothetical protein